MRIFCPEHKSLCKYSSLYDKYFCTHQVTFNPVTVCGWSMSGEQAHAYETCVYSKIDDDDDKVQ